MQDTVRLRAGVINCLGEHFQRNACRFLGCLRILSGICSYCIFWRLQQAPLSKIQLLFINFVSKLFKFKSQFYCEVIKLIIKISWCNLFWCGWGEEDREISLSEHWQSSFLFYFSVESLIWAWNYELTFFMLSKWTDKFLRKAPLILYETSVSYQSHHCRFI